MNSPTGQPFQDRPADDLAALYASYKRRFSPDDLCGYVNGDDKLCPLDAVLDEAEALLAGLKPRANAVADPGRVAVSREAAGQILHIIRHAHTAGFGRTVFTALRRTESLLRRDPSAVGTRMYEVRRLRLSLRQLATGPVYVEFGVHDDQLQVVIRRVRWLDDPAATA